MIYLFNYKEELIHIVPRKAVSLIHHTQTLTDTRYVSDRLEVELSEIPDDTLSEAAYMAIPKEEDRTKFHLFFIAKPKSYDHLIHLDGVQSGIEELRKSYVEDARLSKSTAVQVAEYLLQGTNWHLRFKPETGQKDISFYFISAFDGLLRVCDKFNLEMQFFVEINNNKIGARYIDLKQRIGTRTGQRVVYGHNALSIIKEEERAEFYTAVIGLGNSEIVSVPEANDDRRNGYSRKKNFKDLVWAKPQNPLDKPKGIPYLELKELTAKYGIKSNTGMRPRIGKVDFDTDDPNELIQMTYDYLVANAHPKVTFSTTTAYLKGEIGDTVRVVRPDMRLDYETRIFEIKKDRLSKKVVEIKLGDHINQSDGSKEIQLSKSESDQQNATVELSKKRALDFLDSAGGFNRNWHGNEEPPFDKVKIGDLWYRPDPNYEGHHVLYSWDGEHWNEVVRTQGSQWGEKIKEDFQKEVDKINLAIDEQDKKAEELLKKSKVYEKVLGSTEDDLTTRISKIVMGSGIIQSEVSRLRVGGRNLMVGTKEFSGDWFNKAKWTLEQEKYLGLSVYSRQEEWLGLSEVVEVRLGETYTFSAYVKSSIENDLVFMYLDNRLVEPRASLSLTRKDILVGTNWTRVSATFSVTKAGLMTPRFERNNKNAKLYVAGYKLELGNVRSDWSQADEDSETKIDAVSTKVTQLAGAWSVKNLNSSGDIVSQINTAGNKVRIQGELIHLNGKTLIDEAVIDGGAIKTMTADKITGGELNFAIIRAINFDAQNVTSGIFNGLTFRGGKVVSLNGEVDIDLQVGQFNINTDNAAIRRVKEGYSSQFIKMITGNYIGEYGTGKASLTVIGSNSDRSENIDNSSFAGLRFWNSYNTKVSQSVAGKTNESFAELVSDRFVIRTNNKNYSNWLFHNNVPGGISYFMPMNENGVKHFLGRGDKLFDSIYVRNVYTGGNYSLNQQIWDLLTCFGQLRRNNWQFTSHAINHISQVLNQYGV